MDARITVDNNTGHALHFVGCGPVFQVEFEGSHVSEQPISPACAQDMTMPVGASTYRVRVQASYNECSPAALPTVPACGPHGAAPALPAGRYTLRTYAAARSLPVPPDTAITVTP